MNGIIGILGLMLKIMKRIIEPYKNLLWIDTLAFLIKVFIYYLTIVVPYLIVILISLVFGILFWTFPNIIDFTVDYFYSGEFLFIPAYRIHLAWLFISFLIACAVEQ